MTQNGILISLFFVLHATFSIAQVANTNLEIPASPDCVWEKVTDLGNWSKWNGVFDITLDGSPQIGTLLTIKSSWSFGPPSFVKERISVIENTTIIDESDTTGMTNITFMRICWDLEQVGLPNLSGDAAFLWIPLPLYSISTERCIVLRENIMNNSTDIRNYLKMESLFGAFFYLFYGYLTKQGFERFNEALLAEVGRTDCA